MNAPAVPEYVRAAAGDFADCPPGHRFNLYFPVWNETGWQLDKHGKTDALRHSLKLGSAAKVLDELNKRQCALARALAADHCVIKKARSTAPFATGLGLEHPIENGFAFLSPYGVPYLAGSGVKGVLRRAAEELYGEKEQSAIDALFGHENDDDARRGALTCWDVFPVPPKDGPHKDSLAVEIMTPHYSDYYQGNSTPHDAGKPNPIPFLAVPAGSTFRFVITCEPALLTDLVPSDEWKTLIGKIIEHAFDWLGFGAKTAVGYGAMEEDARAKADRERKQREIEEVIQRQQQEAARQQALLTMSPAERAMQEFLDARIDKNQPELNALLGGLKKGEWSGDLKIEIAGHVKKMMEADKKWKEKSEKKKPEKDTDYQDTLKVMEWLQGK